MKPTSKSLAPVLMLLVTSMLAGCETVQAAKDYAAERQRLAEEARIEIARVSCRNYGFLAGSDAFAPCVQTEVNQTKLREELAAQPTPTSSHTTHQSQPAQAAQPSAATTTCRKTIFGTMECTTR